ncbi:hypothetical protein GCM10011505_19940 [Tistrella bauzanensis]|uniref:DUF2076 domain-containing protein n=1 Tax=Tistrella bauzanensis TaxID=657419 RepID=A0ABQ1IG02_9PROT|nr:DUF2076 domain-containing protein [Tistrella bauzanensis]GGB38407.1 hypothetical protein GCM10011505_19940 [Tistrella bauzanensis]
MDAQDRKAIDDLFARLGQVEQNAGPRDAEADAVIRQQVSSHPAAPYYMAQTIVVQEHALNAAQQRIQELEQTLASRPASGGFLSSLFGGGNRGPQPAPQPRAAAGYGQQQPGGAPGYQQQQPGGAPWGAQAQQHRRGGGFLAGAAQTAMGVAGGVVLGNMIAGMLSPDEAMAAAPEEPMPEEMDPAADMAADDGGFFGGDEELF